MARDFALIRSTTKCLGSGNQRDLAVPDLRVVADVRDWSAPCVLAALTTAVHDRQGAACTEHNHRDNNQ
jgi:hypothetical protein